MSVAASLARRCAVGLALGSLACAAAAKLPAPGPEAQAKAAETAAKAAWSGKVDAYKLCQAQDRVVAHYRRTAPNAAPAVPAPACLDPGPFSYTPPEAKPLEAAGAHSPAGTATSPPNTAVPAAAASAPKS